MITVLPEPKRLIDNEGFTTLFTTMHISTDDVRLLEIANKRFWNYPGILGDTTAHSLQIDLVASLESIEVENEELFRAQGYALAVTEDHVTLRYEHSAGYINGLTTIKMLLQEKPNGYVLPCCEIVDWPSVAVRAVAPTFSWYAGYGRIGFDSQLWNYDKWIEFLNISMDNKINQFNMVMYGYWPFEFAQYPETVLKDVPLKIWNAENNTWLPIKYTHPNIVNPYLDRLIEYGHMMEFSFFAYVGLNSYNGGYSIKHPEARMIPPKSSQFLNDFDSLCLSNEQNVEYILSSMRHIAQLGFDGFSLEESEEGFWFCECESCKSNWRSSGASPGEAKHKANIWLLNRIWETVKSVNSDAILGIRAFRQPPLEKDPSFLEECVRTMPKGINLFWAPGLYVPETEFPKWVDAFGKDHIWGRDTEANSITSTMGRLYRTFASNLIRYEDEANEQVIETDIAQHLGSIEMGVHGINGFMFEWYGLFLHEFAHGNYGWGSKMEPETFFKRACQLHFGHLGEKVLYVMKNMLTIHESQMPFYTTAFPFQKNKIQKSDIPAIMEAKERHPKILAILEELQTACNENPRLQCWAPHFSKLNNAERRNAVIYDMVLASLAYEEEQDPVKKDALLDEILLFNERDFAIAKEMFFDVNPVSETGVKSCMFPYHEIKRLIHNIKHPEEPDNDIICSGIEALGWLWL
ncbi:glycoside hydrolase family 20 zincin-like fold domain-containing protein [uncultured Sphaerochaeta sp.]|uniref:glycoside hydrolase family 20 zincin-like fold domain-containing protein n=1 Tax=uncultured Sphaerochaeta sp. TaxID=886478 RepID=UPI0029C9D62C|nr:glycoside hydrolase family 20 zincin-like fold domain-containing protein [uncultured Sphaerochaeta sp.]